MPLGHDPREPDVILEWVDYMERDASSELIEALAEYRRLHFQLQEAGHRARDAVSTAAWLFYVRERASSSRPDLLRRDD